MNDFTDPNGQFKPFERFSQKQLNDAWDMICPERYWKDQIDSICFTKDAEVISEAIIFFTGSKPDFYTIPNRPEYLKVTGLGYELGPCGNH